MTTSPDPGSIVRVTCRGALIGFLAITFFLRPAHEANADHITHLVHRYDLSGFPQYTVAMRKWTLEHTQANFCIDSNFNATAAAAFRAAIADWNTAFSVPGGAPLVENCAWQVGFRPHYPEYPCESGAHGCTRYEWGSAERGGYYITAAHIWLDTWRTDWNANGWRAMVAHELGHVFGLDERYFDDGTQPLFTCNNNETTIMDTAYSTGHCDGIVSPQGLDKARAYDWYNMRSVPMGSIQNVSYQIFRYYFTDRNYAESNYAETVQRWDGAGTWVDVGWQNDNGVALAPCDDFQPCTLNDIFPVSGSGYFRVCLVPHNGVYGSRPLTCSNYVYSP